MKRITEIFEEARDELDATMGSHEFVRRLHAAGEKQDPDFTRLKENHELGFFAELYNAANNPKLVWARPNDSGSCHADFTVWDEGKSWSHDLELTGAWEAEDAFPRYPDMDNPGIVHVELGAPKEPLPDLREKLQRTIVRNVVKRHARRKKYAPYWLAVYVNFSREAYKVPPDWVAEIVREALKQRPPTPNVGRVWVWSHDRIDLVFSAP